MRGTSDEIRSLFLSLIMVTSMVAAGAALAPGAAGSSAAEQSVSSSGTTFATLSPPGAVSDNTQSDTVAPGERTTVANLTFEAEGNVSNVTVDVSAGNGAANITPDDVDNIVVELFNSSGDTVADTGDVTYDSLTKTVSVSDDNVTNVSRAVVRAETSNSNSENNDILDASVTLEDNGTGSVGPIDTAENQTIETEFDARLRGEVLFQNGTAAKNVTVQIVDTDTGNVLTDDIETRGDDTSSPGTWGPRVASPGNYTVELDDTGATTSDLQGQVAVFSTQVELERGETEKIETTLDPLQQPADVSCTSVNVEVGETGVHTVTVRDDNGETIGGADVELDSREGSDAPTITPTTATTDDDGEATFEVTSDVVAATTFIFNVTNADTTVQVECDAVFFQSGEGSIQGTVLNDATTDPVENASVWTVLADQYDQNTVQTNVDLTGGDTDPNSSSERIWIRLIDNETGEVVPTNEYDFRVGNITNSSAVPKNDTAVRRVQEMNVSNGTAGEGYVVIDRNNDGNVSFTHTRLQDREYFVQRSLDAPNASEVTSGNSTVQRENESIEFNSPEDFSNVTSVNARNFVVGTGGDPLVFSPTANLTLAATEERSDLARSNLVDSPGFENYPFGDDTGGTNENGQYKLTRLFSDFQNGTVYVAIARKPGLSADFADVQVTEDGELVFNENQDDVNFNLVPRPVDAEVNITDIAVVPEEGAAPDETQNVSAYDAYAFGNTTDAFNQRVPRDGTSLDVLLVETETEKGSTPLSREVTLEVPDRAEGGTSAQDFDGDWVVPAGVEVVEEDSANDTVTIRTDSDGQAIVWLAMDFSNADLNQVDSFSEDSVNSELTPCRGDDPLDAFSGITAFVPSDRSATDETCKRFNGVTRFDRASLSGILTDNRDIRVQNTFVYVDALRWNSANDRVSIEPVGSSNGDNVDEPTDKFNVSYYSEDGVNTGPSDTFDANEIPSELVSRVTVNRTELPAFDFGAAFPNIDSNGPFKLAERSPADDSEFTLKDVPAARDPSTTGPTTNYDVRGVALATDQFGELGNATAATKPGFTDDANIAFPFRAKVTFQVEDGSLDAPSTVGEGDSFDVSANITNTGSTSGSEPVQFRLDTDDNGVLETDEVIVSESPTLGAGETQTVTLTVPSGATNGLNGTFTHGAVSIDTSTGTVFDQETGTVEIGESGLGSLARFDNNSNGEIDFGEVTDAISAYNNGDQIGGEDVEFGDVTDLIAEYNS